MHRKCWLLMEHQVYSGIIRPTLDRPICWTPQVGTSRRGPRV
jgi:hypothetical protein